MTYKLVAAIKNYWPSFDGMCASQGFDPLELPWDRFLNLAYWFLTKDADPDGLEKFERALWMPPSPNIEVEHGPWSAAAETAALASFGQSYASVEAATE